MVIFEPRVAILAIATLGLYPFARSGAKDGWPLFIPCEAHRHRG